ncbi:MAG TPA: TMEM165/GDT1 family protein [Chloroflexota bacterium]|jgi:putative Ca2+/H+ antiporter (TMEM165/GDT1 family)
MDPFLQSAALIALAEMGDKSQLAALAFATRFSARLTLAAIAAATLVVHLASVVLGEVLGVTLPTFWIHLLGGLAFIGFGLWTLRGDSYDADERPKLGGFGPFVSIAATFFLAELGDKTMLATITLGSQLNAFVPVWLGSTVGMVAADAVAIAVGRMLGKRLPERAIRLSAAVIFLIFGGWEIAQTLAKASL